MKTTYISKGLLELHITLNAGGAEIPIHFTGGTIGSNGVISARFTTDNPAIQKLIEKSEYFRKRRIVKL